MPGALSGLKILDFSTLWPGPLATMLLADLGAEVLRVEAPDRPDLLRYLPPYGADGEGAAYSTVNRNKKSLILNLKSPEAASVVQRLVAEYDIVIEQFRPGVLDRLGVGFEALRVDCPGLIWCSITSYGQTGPWRDRPGHDIDFMAISGIASHMGRAKQGPSHPGVLLGDVGGGTFGAVTGVLAAVIHRHATGRGQLVDISMADGTLWLNLMEASGVLAGGLDARPGEHPLAGGSAYDYYRTLDGGWLAVGALEPKFWAMFCHAIGRPDLEQHEASDAVAMAELKHAVAHTLAGRDLIDWQGVFAQVPCCVEPVLSTREALAHPQFQARGLVVDVPLQGGGTVKQVANPVRLQDCPPRYDHAAVLPGTHTDAVLAECGFDATEIARLRRDRAIA